MERARATKDVFVFRASKLIAVACLDDGLADEGGLADGGGFVAIRPAIFEIITLGDPCRLDQPVRPYE